MTPVTAPAYEYHATLRRVVDGDTLDLAIDLGFECTLITRARLLGVNTPEVVGVSKQQGLAAAAFVQQWLDARGGNVLVRSFKAKQREKYGRWLVEVWGSDGNACLNTELLDRGLATKVAYP